jgi:hypothetical protein
MKSRIRGSSSSRSRPVPAPGNVVESTVARVGELAFEVIDGRNGH